MRSAFLLLLALATALGRTAAAAEAVLAPGQPLDHGQIQAIVGAALADRGVRGPLALRVDRPELPLANRAAGPIRLSLVHLEHDPRTGRFSARIEATLAGARGTSIAVAGTAEELAEMLVPRRALAAGETIAGADLVVRRVPTAELRPDMLVAAEELVGRQAARALPAGRPLRARDVAAPDLVRRGDPVRLVYAAGGLEITAAGVALGAGRAGDPVEVRNAASGEVRRGVVTGLREVVLRGAGGAP